MQEIKVVDYKGKEFSGVWNEKTYMSRISDKPELRRIYVNNEEIHITKEEYEKLLGDSIAAKQLINFENKNHIKQCIDKLSVKDKLEILEYLMNDKKIKELCYTDREIKDNRDNIMCFLNIIHREEEFFEINGPDEKIKARRLIARANMPDEYKATINGELISSKDEKAIEELCNKVLHKTYDQYQCFIGY